MRRLTCRIRRHHVWRVGTKGWHCGSCVQSWPLMRCAIRLHYPAWWDPHSSYDEPPDPWWCCAECEAFLWAGTLRGRLVTWLWMTRLGEWIIDWEHRRERVNDEQEPGT